MTDTAASKTEDNLDKAVASLSIDTVTYHPKYKQAVDGVVLVSSDEVAFRVEDFYLKASSAVFREMLSLPTNGGPIGLPETSVQIRMVLDNITDNGEEGDIPVDDMIAALGLARKFEFANTCVMFRQALLDNDFTKDAPIILAHACQMRPVDRRLAKHAISLFNDLMPMNSAVYRHAVSNKKRGSASPSVNNLTSTFFESLGVIGAVAYALTLEDCAVRSQYHWKAWDWSVVPQTFVDNVSMLERKW